MEEKISKFMITADISYARMIFGYKKNGKQTIECAIESEAWHIQVSSSSLRIHTRSCESSSEEHIS